MRYIDKISNECMRVIRTLPTSSLEMWIFFSNIQEIKCHMNNCFFDTHLELTSRNWKRDIQIEWLYWKYQCIGTKVFYMPHIGAIWKRHYIAKKTNIFDFLRKELLQTAYFILQQLQLATPKNQLCELNTWIIFSLYV